MTVKPLINHITELRLRLFSIIVVFVLFFIIGFFISNYFIEIIINDLIAENIKLIVLTPLEFIYAKLRVGFLFALTITLPAIIYQSLMFAKPALTSKEKSALKLILPSFILLFLAGIIFSYFIFLPVALYFLANLTTFNILNMWSLTKFISFIFITTLSLGLVFQIPLLMLILNKLNIINIKILKKNRKIIYVLAFVLAAITTPPDVVTQIIIALPLILLYEASFLFVRVFK